MSKEAVLNELNSQVGSLIHQSEWIDISQEKIDAFCGCNRGSSVDPY